MNNLIKIDLEGLKELIPVYKTDKNEKVVVGRELYEGLKVRKDFSDWMRNQLELVGAIEGKEFSSLKGKTSEQGGRPSVEYVLSLDIAKEICMVAGIAPRANEETKRLSKDYRKYFIEIEKQLENPFKHLSKEVQAIFAIDKKQQELEGEVKGIKQEIKTIKETATLTPAHCDILNKKYRANIVKILGGKDSAAYKDNSLRSQVYSNFHKEVAKEFGVTSYKQILVRDLDRFIQFINDYKPQDYLLMAIVGYNSQLKFSIEEAAIGVDVARV